MILNSFDKYRDKGLLILRIGLGIMFMIHGYPKITGGIEKWTDIGGAMENLGITFMPAFWGFMASFAEFFGGLLLIIGLLFRPANFLLFFTMFVAALMHIKSGDPISSAYHSIEDGIVFLSLIFIGPGIYSLDEKIGKKE